ncbi:Hypothetical protein LUCI_3530 [Lucifera butyrica]|uniref:histidine kinase n=1 Tax=Lucifera butyrica TaxID=1351585 RepID=A0A498RAN3_9FIRM|nr:HAMP domain-containing protein [Lucifera butyrica]VBB08259.1 Hypothetical protein LUCI_3530 [Lucifera butyrica]
MNSIIYRITGLTFLTVVLTSFLLIYLANLQMTEQFNEYLVVQQMEMYHSGMLGHINAGNTTKTLVIGPMEETFLSSFHQSLIWVGLAILLLGLGASYALARSITVPLRNLSRAAEQIEKGNFNQKVPVETRDEVGHLASIFNRMAEGLMTNTNLRRQLLANIAHELRTPLAVIQGNLEGMVDGVIEPSKEQLTSLYEEAIRLNRLIRDLRDLSLAEVRQLVLEKYPADINQIISRVVTMLKPLTEEKAIQIDCLLAAELPEVSVDRDRISQVPGILQYFSQCHPVFAGPGACTGNDSADANSKSALALRIHPGQRHWDCTGGRSHIFDHFYRGDKSRDPKSGGSGLGLAIVKQLVEIHGGRVAVTSEPGKGSVFQVMLPVDRENRHSV